MRLFYKTKGAISIYLAIILVPVMAVSSLFVDASKLKLAGGVIESSGDLTLNTALTDYDTVLKDMYGLFATAQDTTELFEKLEDYYRTCITSSGVSEADANSYVDQIMMQLGMVADDNETADILNMELVDFNVSKRSDASLNNAVIMKKQIVDFMKYRAPINTGLSFIQSLKSFSTLSKQTELVDKRQEYYKEQESVMQNVLEAWKRIYRYNQSPFASSDEDNSKYFRDIEAHYPQFESEYQNIAKKIIMDLYDAQNYGEFNPRLYSIEEEKVEVNGAQKTIPIFYTKKDKSTKRLSYNELTTYSELKKASAENIRQALIGYYNAYNNFKTSEKNLLKYDKGTYGQQYLIQTNRKQLYTAWTDNMVTLYDKYSELRHAATYGGKTEDGKSVMETKEKICGSSTEKAYSDYYADFTREFKDDIAKSFTQKIKEYNSTLAAYENECDTNKEPTAQKIAGLYQEVAGNRAVIVEAQKNLVGANKYLGDVLAAIKPDGALEQKKIDWNGTAKSSELKNTSMAKQDLAEIDSLSTYLTPDYVQPLIDRLNNIIKHLNDMIRQIDSYTFFGTKIYQIDSYETFCHILAQKIGDSKLKNVSTNKQELEKQVDEWCKGQFVVGEPIDVSWENQTGTQANLKHGQLNFYSYLYEHFHNNTFSKDDNSTEVQENTENGKDLFNEIKKKSSEKANNDANSNSSGDTSGGESGDNSTANEARELKDLPDKPSSKNDAATTSANVVTDESAAKETSKNLGGMFSRLSQVAIDMGKELRDNLYVSDYILSMFSYDTVEKELKQKKPEASPQTLTLIPLNASNNYAFKKEVEYILYGGSNTENLIKSYGSIYGIRFGFNVIYAFMQSEIRDSALAIATPISAATLGVIPVPLIQAAIIIGLACCESGLDLLDLRDGKKVPLFKNKDTWRLSVSGLLNFAKEKGKEIGKEIAKESANKLIDVGQAKLTEYLDMTDAKLNEDIDQKTDEITRSVGYAYDTLITRHANMAIQKLTTLANNAFEEYALNPALDKKQYISEGLDTWIENERANSNSKDLAFMAKEEAVKIIKERFLDLMIKKLQDIKKQGVDGTIGEVEKDLNDVIGRIRLEIENKIKEAGSSISKYKTDMIDKLKESMKDGAGKLKETLNQQIDGIFGNTESSAANSDNTGVASLLAFSYSDYLRLFLVIGLYANEEAILLRTGDVIQANVGIKKGEGFRLSNSSAYVELNATIQVKPTMLALPLFDDVEGNPSTDSSWYTIEYRNIKGY